MPLRRKKQLAKTILDYLPFRGGLDLVTPTWEVKPGMLAETQNYEIAINDGYERIQGYERFDGQTAPSNAQYGILDVTITGEFSVGDTITGVTSGATAVVVAIVTSETPNYLVVTKISGTFVSETLNVSGSPEGTITGAPVIDGASTTLLHAQYKNLAADEYRGDIAAVPGSGAILGVWLYSGVVYAFRNNAGGTAAALYKSSTGGWTSVALGRELAFTSGGTTEIIEGNTITGATSGATAVVTRVALESGSWAAGDAAGKFVFASQTGTFQAENIDVGASTNLATIAGDSSAITLQPNGRYEFITQDFGEGERVYGCDGANRGFEFDGTVFVPIDTGMSTDMPNHVIAHKKHLFFSFDSSTQHSGIGTPYSFTIISGAAEINVGDTVTAFQTETGSEGNSALGILSRNTVHILYGDSSSDWNLVKYRDEIGAYAYTVQQVGTTIMLDDRGVAQLRTVETFGNFQHSTLSRLIKPFLVSRKNNVTASCIARDKDQYRLFFSDSSALYVTMNGFKVRGFMPILFTNKVECILSLEDSDGSEKIFFGSDDGFVYQLEKGTSFDGDEIESFMTFHYYNSRSPRINKSYKSITLEAQGSEYASFNFSYELGYTSTEIAQPITQATELELSSGQWDSGNWDAGFWDGQTLRPSRFSLSSRGENIRIKISGNSDFDAPIKYTGAIFRLIPRRQIR